MTSTPKEPTRMGWNAVSRRAVQYDYNLLQRPPQFKGNTDQWREPDGVIQRSFKDIKLTGNRSRQTVKTILLECVAKGDSYDAGNRSNMQ